MFIYENKPVLDYSHKLSKLHRSGLPNAVRFTLNDLAREVKKTTLQEEAKKKFNVKKPTFFRKFSGYKQADGWDMSKMKSTAGMVKGTPKNSKSFSSTEIGEQQTAGTVNNKSYLPSKNQRSSRGLVKKSYIDKIKQRPIRATAGKGYVKKWSEAKKQGKTLLVVKGNRGIVVEPTKRLKRKKNPFAVRVIGSYKKNRKIDLKKKKPFVIDAAKESSKHTDKVFIKHAEKQIQRLK